MLNNKVLSSVLKTYGVKKARLKENNNSIDLIIIEMNDSFPLERWNYFETILKDLLNKKVNILTYNQVLRYFGESFIEESQVIV